ncbi:hypothetical protein BGZ94_002206 [Podila epigama]|nr:hypothetical protein BGZ94_002206 [Podila epigama]
MKLLTIVASVAALALVKAATPSWGPSSSCAVGTPLFTSSFTPDTLPLSEPCKSTVRLFLAGSVSQPIVQGATIKVTAKVNGNTVATQTHDFCGLLNYGTECPLQTDQGLLIDIEVPKLNVPTTAPVEYTFNALNTDGKTVFCYSAVLSAGQCPSETTTTPAPTGTPNPGSPIPVMYPKTQSCDTNIPQQQEVTSLTIKPGFCVLKPFTLTAAGALSAPIIDGAKINISGRYLGRLVYSDSKYLCPLLAEAGTPCPIATTATSWSVTLPQKGGMVNVLNAYLFRVTNGDGGIVFCKQSTMLAVKCPA